MNKFMSFPTANISMEEKGHSAYHVDDAAIVNINGISITPMSDGVYVVAFPAISIYGRDDMRPIYQLVNWNK